VVAAPTLVSGGKSTLRLDCRFPSICPCTASFTALGAHDKDSYPKEPREGKACAVSRTERIANRVGRSSGQMTPRRTTNLDPKERGDKSMSVKRGTVEDVYAVALQRLSDTAKAGIA
jgi:hypothetical protein